MTDLLDLDRDAAVQHHPRSPDASPEELRSILGSIALTGPVPSGDFLDDQQHSAASPDECGGD